MAASQAALPDCVRAKKLTNHALQRHQSVVPFDAAGLRDEIWAEAARVQGGSGGHPPRAWELAATRPVDIDALPMPLALHELLALDGDAFADAAYTTLLLRWPDEMGRRLIREGLAAGQTKVLMLGGLARSAEGRAAGQTLRGLQTRFFIDRLARLPGVGTAIRVGGRVLDATRLSRLFATRPAAAVSPAQMQAYIAAYALAADGTRKAMAMRIAALQAALDDANRETLAITRALTRQLGPDWRRPALHTPAANRLGFAERLAALEPMLSAGGLASQVDAATAAVQRAFAARVQGTEAAAARATAATAEQAARLSAVIDVLRSEPAMARIAATLDTAEDHALDPLYVSFEDAFRGSRADIMQRQRHYLPLLAECHAGGADRPVLDIGCGRGEFLELLRDTGLTGRGVDANTAMAAQCRALGLDVLADDAIGYLSRQESGAFGAVTGFHIIEHLPFRVMVRLFDEALRVLAPGGLMMFETPNPANLIVGSHTFWFDPTHQRPLPADMVAMVARHRGFAPVEIQRLHPRLEPIPGIGSAALDDMLNGPQDYAVIATRP